jgi:exodeoxyribonuclease VII small subunit
MTDKQRVRKDKTEDNPDFEKSLDRLETIVDEMEKGSLSLETMMEHFEEGQKLIDVCTRKLNEVERKIEILVKKGDEVAAEPFESPDPDAEDEKNDDKTDKAELF